jgi:hypothetical protein
VSRIAGQFAILDGIHYLLHSSPGKKLVAIVNRSIV